jgi:hypothetical protein
MSMDDILESLEEKHSLLVKKNQKLMSNLIANLSKEDSYVCSYDREFNYDNEEILLDMQYKNPYTSQFKSYLIRKHEKDRESASGGYKLSMNEDSENPLSNPLSYLQNVSVNPIENPPIENLQISIKNPEKLEKLEKVENPDNLNIIENPENLPIKNPTKTSTGIILSRAEEERDSNPDDIVCLICNDGDYEDHDLIVYCSSCGMTVHQSCYGIVVLPQDDWICYPCIAFGVEEAKTVECVLCPVKGGAMKPCNLKKGGQVHNIIMGLRKESESLNMKKQNVICLDMVKLGFNNYNKNKENNNNYSSHETPTKFERVEDARNSNTITEESEIDTKDNNEITFENLDKFETPVQGTLPSLAPTEKVKNKSTMFIIKKEEPEVETKTNKPTGPPTLVSSSSPKKRGRRKKFNKKELKKHNSSIKVNEDNGYCFNEFINKKIAKENAWVHLSCALWLPEVYIADYEKKDEIKSKI